MRSDRVKASVTKALRIMLVLCLAFTCGCAELRMTAHLFNIALMELFRLPVYCMRMPFQIIQSLGPAIQAGIRSAANVAPLLLFIENTPREKDKFYAAAPDTPEKQAVRALNSGNAVPLLDLLDRETGGPSPVRFTLVEPRLLAHRGAREAILASLGSRGERVRCVLVDGKAAFSRQGDFLALCRKMRERGDVLIALTTFNEELAALTGTAIGDAPAPESCPLVAEWNRFLEEHDQNAHCQG